MEIVSIEMAAFMEMGNVLQKIKNQLKELEREQSGLDEWLDNQEACILMNMSLRKLLSLRQKGLIPYSRIDRKVYYKKDDIMNYMKHNLKTGIIKDGNRTDCTY